jgi:putative ABC transport system permease protein
MSILDLLVLIIENLSRRKTRVALTAVGVVIGTAAVVILVSLGFGQQRSANEQLYGIGDLSLINVEPNFGDVGGPAGVVIGPGGGGGGGGGGTPPNLKLITDASLEEMRAIPGVQTVVARDWMQASAIISIKRLETWIGIVGVSIDDMAKLGLKTQKGSLVLEKGTAVIGSYIKQNFYDPRWRPGMPQPTPPELVDELTKLTLIKYSSDGTEIRKSQPLRIVGEIAESRTEADYSIYMRLEDVTAINEWAMGRRVNRSKDGYPMVIVKAQDVQEVLDIADQIEALGYRVYTQMEYVQGINSFYLLQQVIFGGVGAIALLVAAIGIANTMAMAILERTREIGLMKAIGATNRDVLSIFLGEAAGIGFVGGLGGVLLGWSGGQIINVVALAYLAGQSATTGAPPPTVAVYTPLWLPLGTLAFATLIGLLSGLYPALRAATLIPVNALKYE